MTNREMDLRETADELGLLSDKTELVHPDVGWDAAGSLVDAIRGAVEESNPDHGWKRRFDALVERLDVILTEHEEYVQRMIGADTTSPAVDWVYGNAKNTLSHAAELCMDVAMEMAEAEILGRVA